ncbi:MAG: enolase C-terminal domain-like protein [Bryobacteraceae bacterium]|nr:enolase C-terminal domain-like protein [Bryobacteraceae bacterium]
MKRRELLTGAALAAALPARHLAAQNAAARATRATPSPKIKDVQVITCQPAGVRLIVVKVITDQDGLYGYGCGTFTQRADLVPIAVENYLKPFLIGKPADRIDDLWQAMYNSSYWRNGPVLNNAISGVDQALWDIKGRQANMPVYQLLGGKVREAADTYVHASGAEIPQVIDQVKKFMAEGYRHVRVQVGVPGMAGYGSGRGEARVASLHTAPVFEPSAYIRRTLKLFEACRTQLGEEIELCHDVHERITPTQAVQMCKDVEKFKLFFFEDPLSPEDIAWFRLIRQQCTTPIAMGELFNSPHEWSPLIAERLIDFIRVHVSQAGGLTPCRKMAIMAEHFGVRTAWHGPGDVSPVGHMANVTLDVASYNFGIQEYSFFNAQTREIFDGVPEGKDGYMWVSEKPGWGIEINEAAAKKYPFRDGGRDGRNLNGGWGEVRKRDGQIIKQ